MRPAAPVCYVPGKDTASQIAEAPKCAYGTSLELRSRSVKTIGRRFALQVAGWGTAVRPKNAATRNGVSSAQRKNEGDCGKGLSSGPGCVRWKVLMIFEATTVCCNAAHSQCGQLVPNGSALWHENSMASVPTTWKFPGMQSSTGHASPKETTVPAILLCQCHKQVWLPHKALVELQPDGSCAVHFGQDCSHQRNCHGHYNLTSCGQRAPTNKCGKFFYVWTTARPSHDLHIAVA